MHKVDPDIDILGDLIGGIIETAPRNDSEGDSDDES